MSNFLLQFLSSIAQNVSVILKNTAKLFQFSSILFDCMKKSYGGLAASQCYL